MFDNVVGEIGKFESHVFESVHGGIKVEVLDVDCHVVGVLGGDGAVLVQLDNDQGDGGRTAVAGTHDAVPSIVKRVLFGSSFVGLKLATMRPYVISRQPWAGTSFFLMKNIVLVPSTFPGMPWAR